MNCTFVLVEIALNLLGIAFLAFTVLVAFFLTNFPQNQDSQSRSYATNAIQYFMSYLKQDRYGGEDKPFKVLRKGSIGFSQKNVDLSLFLSYGFIKDDNCHNCFNLKN